MKPIQQATKDYIAILWSTWLDGVDAILKAGRILLDAKEEIPHGEFLAVIEGSPFSEDTAEKLMAIAKHPVISKSAVRRNLPPAYRTLYELTRLPLPALQQALENGSITPDLKEHQARKLWRDLPERDRGELYTIFACASCGERKLRSEESRPSVLGENAEARPRLYECDACGKTTLTEERVAGPFAKKSLPKAGKTVEGERVTVELPVEPQTGAR